MADMSDAMIKTLALVAYSQPVSQSEIVKTRGNRGYHYIKRLLELGFIQSRKQGRTKILTLTQKFYEYFQIKDLSSLFNADDDLKGYIKFEK